MDCCLLIPYIKRIRCTDSHPFSHGQRQRLSTSTRYGRFVQRVTNSSSYNCDFPEYSGSMPSSAAQHHVPGRIGSQMSAFGRIRCKTRVNHRSSLHSFGTQLVHRAAAAGRCVSRHGPAPHSTRHLISVHSHNHTVPARWNPRYLESAPPYIMAQDKHTRQITLRAARLIPVRRSEYITETGDTPDFRITTAACGTEQLLPHHIFHGFPSAVSATSVSMPHPMLIRLHLSASTFTNAQQADTYYGSDGTVPGYQPDPLHTYVPGSSDPPDFPPA